MFASIPSDCISRSASRWLRSSYRLRRDTHVASHDPEPSQAPSVLSVDELVALATEDPPPARFQQKLENLLSTPFIRNEATTRGARPKIPRVSALGPVLRVAEWNINRGENELDVELALTDSNKFLAAARKDPSLSEKDLSVVAEELHGMAEDRLSATLLKNPSHQLPHRQFVEPKHPALRDRYCAGRT